MKFLFVGPMVFALLVAINLLTWQGEWWVQWPAIALGIAWVVCLARVLKAMIIAGGLVALIALLRSR